MKRKNSATAALTASRWKKISKKRRRKKSLARRLPKAASPNRLVFLRLPRPSPNPPRLLQVAEAAAASPQPRRNQPRSPRRKKRPRNLQRKRLRSPQRKKQRRNLQKRRPARKARSAVKSAVGRERLRILFRNRAPLQGRGFFFPEARARGEYNF